jgi:hypothetical protein
VLKAMRDGDNRSAFHQLLRATVRSDEVEDKARHVVTPAAQATPRLELPLIINSWPDFRPNVCDMQALMHG